MSQLSRRTFLTSSAALSLSAGFARADAPMLGPSFGRHRRFSIGDFEVTTLLAGTASRENPQSMFGANVSEEVFAEVSEEAFLSTDEANFFFTPVIVNTGSELILFDTGLNADGTLGALAEAGYAADQVDTVVITHMHGDHIGGLQNGSGATFANARYVTAQAEWDHWASAENDGFEASVRPLVDRFTYIGAEQEVASGVTAVAAFGHTPGHMVYRLDSGGEALMIMADLANHPVWSLAHPEWEFSFDVDKGRAAASRRALLEMAASETIPAVFYHMPFPALGFVDTDGDGFRWVPASGQFMG